MSVMEYTAQFNKLSRFAPVHVAIDKMRMVRFEHGLKHKLKEAVTGHYYANFQEIHQKEMKIAQVVDENEAIEMKEVQAKRKFDSGSSNPQPGWKP